MKIDICECTLEAVIRADVKGTLSSLKRDLKSRKSGRGAGIFHTDKDEDVAEIRRHIDAFHIVLKYYGG